VWLFRVPPRFLEERFLVSTFCKSEPTRCPLLIAMKFTGTYTKRRPVRLLANTHSLVLKKSWTAFMFPQWRGAAGDAGRWAAWHSGAVIGLPRGDDDDFHSGV
jgi:hypothetical protein